MTIEPLFDQFQKKIEAASRALKRLSKPKSQDETIKSLRELRQITVDFDWKAFAGEIAAKLQEAEGQYDRHMAVRRESILRAARQKNIPADRRENEDQVDVFRLKYSGEKIVITFAGEEVISLKETDAEKILAKVTDVRRKLESVPFSRDRFFNLVKRTFQRIQQTAPNKVRDGGIPIKELYLEILLEAALGSDRFRKRPSRQTFPEYHRAQFYYDFARFEAGGMIVGDSKLTCKTPSLAQANERVSIPRLSEPLGPGTQVFLIQIQKLTDS